MSQSLGYNNSFPEGSFSLTAGQLVDGMRTNRSLKWNLRSHMSYTKLPSSSDSLIGGARISNSSQPHHVTQDLP